MKKFPALFLVANLFYFNCKADTIPYTIHHYTDENGLPQNGVKYIVPDNSGFIWLATENGLVKFSGYDLTSYDKQNIPINSSRIYHILPGVDPARLFAVTETGDVIVVKDGKVSEVRGPVTLNNEQSKDIAISLSDRGRYIGIADIYKDHVPTDTLFVSAGLPGTYLITKKKVQFDDGRGGGYSIAFERTDPWQFFLFRNKLYYITGKGALLTFADGSIASAGLTGDINSNPVFRKRPEQLRIYRCPVTDCVLLYIGGSLYVLSRLADNRLEANLLLGNFDFDRNNIACAYYDSVHKRIFLGSLTKGMFVFTRNQFRAVNSSEIADMEVQYAQAAYDKERVLAGHGRVLGLSGEWLTLPLLKNWSDSYSLFIDRKQNIWAKNGKSLHVFNKAGTQLLKQWVLSSEITRLYQGKDGIVWIGTLEHGLYRLDPSTAQPVPLSFLSGLHHITYMQQAKDSILWASTYYEGLYRIDLSSKRTDTVQGLQNKFIRSIYITGNDELWATTYGDGFYLYSGNKLVKFPLDKNKYLATAHCITEDDKGYFWITTNKGLFQVAKDDLLAYAGGRVKDVWYLYYDKRHGFNTNEFNGGCQPCAIRLDNGYISFPSMNGLVWVNPAAVKMELPDKKIFIIDAKLGDQPLVIRDTLLLPSRFKLLRLTVTTPYFGDPYNIRMEYAISQGADTPAVWRDVDNNKSISIATLASGTYRLFIRKRQGFGAGNYEYKSLLVHVDSIFYETWQFQVLVGLLLVLCIWAYTRLRLRLIERKNKMLQQRVEEHTSELHEALGQLRLSELNLRRQNRLQELLITSITHDIKNPLKYLVVMTRHLKQQKSENVPTREISQQSVNVLYDASYRMYHLTDNLLQYIRLFARTEGQPMISEAVPLFSIVEEKAGIFHDEAQAKGTIIVNEVPADMKVQGHYLILSIIIHNLLDNAIKYTSEGTITVSADTKEGQQRIMVRDTGIGMNPEIVNWYHEYYNKEVQSDSESGLPRHAGLGLVIVRELIKSIHGRVLIESKPNEGTLVSIILEINKHVGNEINLSH